jgi:DNA-binding NarL/FixJ family response regulator
VRLKCARPAAFNPPLGFWYFLITPIVDTVTLLEVIASYYRLKVHTLLTVQCNMHKLTPREKEVIIAIGNKMTSKQIATSLSLSPRTIHAYLENIYWKLGVSGYNARIDAYNVAVKNKLLD